VVAVGTVGGISRPVIGVACYYWLAILRPELMWFWAFGSTGGSNMSKMVAIGTLLGWLLSGSISNLSQLRNAAIPMIALGIFLVSGALATFLWAENPVSAQENLTLQVKIALMALVAVTVCRTLQDVKVILLMVLFGLMYFAWELNLAWVRYHRIPGNLLNLHGDNNLISLLMVFAIPFGLSIALVFKSIMVRVFAIGGVFASIHAVLFLESRGAYLATAVVVTIYFVWALRVPHLRKHAVLGFFASLFFIWMFAGERVVEEWNSIFLDTGQRDASAQSRVEFAKMGWQMMLDNPLGLGPRQQPLANVRYGMNHQQLLHNLYIQVGADYGFIGIFAYLSFYLLAVRNAFRAASCRVYDEQSRELSIIAFGLAVAVVGFLTAGVFLSCERIEIGIIGASMALAVSKVSQELEDSDSEEGENVSAEAEDHVTEGSGMEINSA